MEDKEGEIIGNNKSMETYKIQRNFNTKETLEQECRQVSSYWMPVIAVAFENRKTFLDWRTEVEATFWCNTRTFVGGYQVTLYPCQTLQQHPTQFQPFP